MGDPRFSHNRKRRRRRRRRRMTPLKIVLIIVIILAIAAGVFFIVKATSKKPDNKTYYLGSTSATVKLYNYDDYGYMVSDDSATRGAEVKVTGKKVSNNGIDYTEIKLDDDTYYVLGDYLTTDPNDIVRETKKWVRTNVTVYADNTSPTIESYLKKGTKLEILGYDSVGDNGIVNMYNIKSDNVTGWVYGKYLADDRDSALAVYNENGEHDTHKNRVYPGKDLGGGDPANLDWYPYEKPSFEDNPFMQNAKAMYLCAETVADFDKYIELAKSSGVDTLVIDIKDGAMTYPSDVAAVESPTSNKYAYVSKEAFTKAIEKAKAGGFYLVGRIVAFNDSTYALDHPEVCIESSASNQNWPSAYSRQMWEYNIRLALEAIEWFDFNEIQFDYVRFPEESYSMSKAEDTDFKNEYDEDKCVALQGFAYYACDVIHRTNTYVSFDVFGECCGKYVTAYGQYWPALSNIIDAISGMPYTDHFGDTVDTWSDPYQTMYDWGEKVAARQSEIPTPSVARTWITCYNVPWWNPTVIYDSQKLIDQVNGLIDAGVPGGFMTWNGVSKYEKYCEVAGCWSYNYDWYKVAPDPNVAKNIENAIEGETTAN